MQDFMRVISSQICAKICGKMLFFCSKKNAMIKKTELFQFLAKIGFYNKNFLEYMGLLIRSYHGKMNTMAVSCQDLSQDCSKILQRSY